MSSKDNPNLERCPKCALRGNTCVCEKLSSISSPVQVTIVRHRKELSRGSNSARILANSIQGSVVIDHGSRYAGPTIIPKTTLDQAVLLFPLFYDPDPKYPPVEWTGQFTPKNLIVLDGSWKQTSRMLKKIHGLTALPRLAVQPLAPPLPRIRKPYFEGGMCTMEATISALQPFLSTVQIDQLKSNYLTWLDQVRKNSGIRNPLKSGQCFKEARIEEEGTANPKDLPS